MLPKETPEDIRAGWESILEQTMNDPAIKEGYATAGIEDRSKAAITGLLDSQRAEDVQPYWFPYLWVEDLDEPPSLARTDA